MYHNIAALRAAVLGAEYARTIVAPVPTIAPNGRVVMGSVTGFTDNELTVTKQDGTTEAIGFDYAVICTGSTYAAPGKLSQQHPKAAVDYLQDLSVAVSKSKNIVVVGGGPVGIELAAEIAAEHGTDIKVTLAHRGQKLFSGAWSNTKVGNVTDKPAGYAKTRLEALGVEVLLGTGVERPAVPPPTTPPTAGAAAAADDAGSADCKNTDEEQTDAKDVDAASDGKDTAADTATDNKESVMVDVAVEDKSVFGDGVTMPTGGKVTTSKGGQLNADLVFWCTGATPNTDWLKASNADLLDERGFVKVDSSLRVAGKSNVFCLGDCAGTGDQKLAYRAGEQADKVVLPNLLALIAAADADKNTADVQLKELEVSKPAAVVSFGPDNAMADFGGFALCDCLVVKMKAQDLFRKEFKEETHGTAADSTDWAAKGVPGWDLTPPAGQAK